MLITLVLKLRRLCDYCHILSSSSYMLELDWYLDTMMVAYSLEWLNYGFDFGK